MHIILIPVLADLVASSGSYGTSDDNRYSYRYIAIKMSSVML